MQVRKHEMDNTPMAQAQAQAQAQDFSCRRRPAAVDRINFALVIVAILLGSGYVLHALWTARALG